MLWEPAGHALRSCRYALVDDFPRLLSAPSTAEARSFKESQSNVSKRGGYILVALEKLVLRANLILEHERQLNNPSLDELHVNEGSKPDRLCRKQVSATTASQLSNGGDNRRNCSTAHLW